MKDFSAFLDMRRYKNWAHEIIFWKYLLEDLFCQFFPEHRQRHFCSPLSALFRGCWKSAAPAAHDLILEEVDDKCQFVVDNPLKRDRVVTSPVNSEDTAKNLPSSRGSFWIRDRTRVSCHLLHWQVVLYHMEKEMATHSSTLTRKIPWMDGGAW